MNRDFRIFIIVAVIGAIVIALLVVSATRAESGTAIIGDGELVDAVAFSNGDTLSVLTSKDWIDFAYTFIGGGVIHERYRVGVKVFDRMKLMVSGRYAHLIASDVEWGTYQYSFKLPDEAPWFNCPVRLLPVIRK